MPTRGRHRTALALEDGQLNVGQILAAHRLGIEADPAADAKHRPLTVPSAAPTAA